jgi:hypothetical protein
MMITTIIDLKWCSYRGVYILTNSHHNDDDGILKITVIIMVVKMITISKEL